MKNRSIKKITLEGFKSIRSLKDFPVNGLNILIGSNGAGKSNLISLFPFLQNLVGEELNYAVGKGGGLESFLFLGSKETKVISLVLDFGDQEYELQLEAASQNQFIFAREKLSSQVFNQEKYSYNLGAGHAESNLKKEIGKASNGVPAQEIYRNILDWKIYHFHDTEDTALVKRPCYLNDNEYFRSNGSNLAAFLYLVKKTKQGCYNKIRRIIQQTAPFFDDFKLRPIPDSPNQIQLEWVQKHSDYPFLAHHLSDGTLRFICLVTALLQPEPPSTIFIDEPELGLHPYSLSLLAGLLQKASVHSQVIVGTQSAYLLDYFEPEDIIIVDREKSETVIKRPNWEELKEWMEHYSLSELWDKNVLGGRP